MFRKFALPGVLVAVIFLLFTAPDTRLEASTCGGSGSERCKENQACVNLLFYKQCTTRIDYWSDRESFR
jgi:hypothetical protein